MFMPIMMYAFQTAAAIETLHNPSDLRVCASGNHEPTSNVVMHNQATISPSRLQYSIASSNSALNCSLSTSRFDISKLGANIKTHACGIVPSTSASTCSFPNPKCFNPLG